MRGHLHGNRFATMKPRPLQVFCDEKNRTWSLSLDMTGEVARALRLSVAPHSQTGARSGKTVADIREPRQVDAVLSRVVDGSTPASELSQELMDLLTTLADERPGPECIAYLQWRLCEWIVESRRSQFNGEHAA